VLRSADLIKPTKRPRSGNLEHDPAKILPKSKETKMRDSNAPLKQNHSMLGGTAGGWSGLVRRLDDPVQKVAKRYQITEGSYNAGAHHTSRVHSAIPQHRRRVWANMGKRQRGEVSRNADVEHPIAENFWDVIRVYCRRLLIGH
jgi:hypothetical protein